MMTYKNIYHTVLARLESLDKEALADAYFSYVYHTQFDEWNKAQNKEEYQAIKESYLKQLGEPIEELVKYSLEDVAAYFSEKLKN